MSWRATVACTQEQAENLPDASDHFPAIPPVLVADEPDESRPDEWVIHAYFERRPEAEDLALLRRLGTGEPATEALGEDDWVTMSQRGLEPIRAGRFFVHTPTHRPDPDATNFEIDAGLAFGTGQHATTAGCLEALDRMERGGARFTNIADVGTGTGILAFAALQLWPRARCIATDIDPVAIDVARDNAAINGIALGHGEGELLLAVAEGLDGEMLVARAPYELIIANILAGPLIELAATMGKAVLRAGTVVLAGLLESQADAVVAAYEAHGFEARDRGSGEWPVLVLCKTA